MKFGLWYHFRNPRPWRRSWESLYAETLDQIAYAEELGYESMWTSEHHFVDDGYLPSAHVVLSAVAQRTERMRLGTLILLLPLHHPLRVAEDTAVLDILSGGRVDLGVAVGYRVKEFEGLEVPHERRGKVMDEAMEILTRSWRPEPFSFHGEFFDFDDIDVQPKPLQDPMPLWMGGQSKPALRRAARYGCGLLPSSTTGFDVREAYHEALRKAGRDPADHSMKCFRNIYCCEDADAGWEEIKEHYLYQHNDYRRWYREAGDSDTPDLEDPDELDRDNYICGTPDECEAAIRKLHEEIPFEEFIFWAYPPGFPVDKSTRSIELFAREVMPRFR